MHPNASRVLVVEASEAALERLRATLHAREIEIERLDDPSRLGDVAAALRPHVLVGGGGVASTIELAGIRERSETLRDIPVVAVLELQDRNLRARLIAAGVDACLDLEETDVEIGACIRMHANRSRMLEEQTRARRRVEELQREVESLRGALDPEAIGLVQEVQRDRVRLSAITELDHALNRIQDFQLMLDRILREARHCCDAEAGTIFIVEGDQLDCRHIQNERLESEGNHTFHQLVRRPLSFETVAGTVALTGRTIRVADAYDIPPEHDCVFHPGRDLASGYRTRALLSIPLRTNDGRIRGVLQLANPGGETVGREFSGEDQLVVEHFATLATVAIERAAMTESLVLRMIAMAELRDPSETGPHVRRVAAYSVLLYDAWVRRNGIEASEAEHGRDRLRLAAMLHDVGKVGIPDAILRKPDRLTSEEYATMQRHTLIGAGLFRGLRTPFDESAREVALHHHERWDGTGYPGRCDPDVSQRGPSRPIDRGLAGEEIPLFARIVGLVDVYDALSSPRSYKNAWSESDVVDEIERGSGTHFDPQLVELLLERREAMRAIYDTVQDSH